jgi:hypothetical protein
MTIQTTYTNARARLAPLLDEVMKSQKIEKLLLSSDVGVKMLL